jgi:DNA-binding NtrC family response regulator
MSGTNRTHRILIADDERGVRDSLAAVFTNYGYETRTADSAESAVEIVAQWLPNSYSGCRPAKDEWG